MSCPSCGQANPEGARFCNACGGGLSAPAPGAPRTGVGGAAAAAREPRAYTPRHLQEKILVSRSALEGERKRVTVLFCDVQGSLELAELVDPETWHSILDHFFQILSEGVHRFEGMVNQYTGDGIMALFGAPIAHEDHAHRACWAALHLQEELRRYADELRRTEGLNFSVRMGLNSGEVIVGKIGDDLRMDYTAQGHTVGLAQRIEQLASADRCYLTRATARLVEGFFDLRDLGEFELKGIREPVHVHELAGVGRTRTRLEVSEARGFSRFVGRDAETARLESALADALEGRGSAVTVVGAAGLGKSRLCVEFLTRAHEANLALHRTHCPSHGTGVPFLALRELLRSVFGVHDGDSPADARRKIAGTLVLLGDVDEQELPALFDLLGVADPTDPAPALDPETRRRWLLDFLEHLVRSKSEREASVLFWDDVHWIDPASDGALARLAEAVRGTRTLLLVNYRPEYRREWVRDAAVHTLELEPLGRDALVALLDDLLGDDASLEPLRERIIKRTGGNPFFIEEVVQTLVESGALVGGRGTYRPGRPVDVLEIPATVQPILAARIDRLGDAEKRLLQIASVIGKRFPEAQLNEVSALSDPDFAQALMVLQDGEFLRVETLFPEVEYSFKHPLTQDVAYESQLQASRARIHADVARALARVEADKPDERTARIAQHFEQAGEALEAARWSLRSVEWLAGTDLDATVSALERARTQAALAAGQDGDAAAPLQLAACVGLVGPLAALNRPNRELEAIFEEAYALAYRLNDVGSLLTLFVIQGIHAQRAGNLEEHERLLEEARRVAPVGDPRSRFVLAFQTGMSRAKQGQSGAALEALDEARGVDLEALAGSETDSSLATLTLRAAIAEYLVLRASMLIRLGRLDDAEAEVERAIALATRYRVAAAGIGALSVQSALASQRGDTEECLRCSESLHEAGQRLGSPLWEAVGHVNLGSALRMAGEPERAIERLEAAFAVTRAEGLVIDDAPYAHYELALAHLALGEVELAERDVAALEEVAVRTRDLEHRIIGELAHARIALARGGADASERAEAHLTEVEQLVNETANTRYTPQALEVRAAVAAHRGERSAETAALREARDRYVDMNAAGHVARLEQMLGGSL